MSAATLETRLKRYLYKKEGCILKIVAKIQILIRKIVIQRVVGGIGRKIVCSDLGSLLKTILYLKNRVNDSNFNSKDRYSEKVVRR